MSGDIFSRYARKEEPEKQVYSAYGTGQQARSETRLMLYYEDGKIGLMAYAYLVEVVCTSHQYVSLIYTNCVITLKGHNLHFLLDFLQDEKIRTLQCFNAREHHEPPGDEPVIMSIKRESLQEAQTKKTLQSV